MQHVLLGECALVLAEDPPASLESQRRIWAFAREVRSWPDVRDVVPAMNNVTLFFARDADASRLERDALRAWDSVHVSDVASGPPVEIPVRYGGADGPDLIEVAERTGLSPQNVVAVHAGAEYVVYFVGFQPGFAYLGGLDARLHVQRKDAPRTAVPAGSVGIAGEQTGVYPRRSPGGWQLIGRTGAHMFDLARERPSLLMPGDRVRFVPVR